MTKTVAVPTAPESLAALTDDELIRLVEVGLQKTAEEMLRLALAVAELERRGRDLSGLRVPLMAHLRLIATGQLLPAAVIRFASRPLHIESLSRLPLAEQQRLIDGGTVPVVDGAGEVQEVPFVRLPSSAVRRVVGEDRVRTASEQRLYGRGKNRRKAAEAEEERRHYTPRADREAGGIRIGKMVCDPVELLAALAEYAGPKLVQLDRNAKGIETVTVICTEAEKVKLRAAEKKRGLPEWHIVREALQAVGLI